IRRLGLGRPRKRSRRVACSECEAPPRDGHELTCPGARPDVHLQSFPLRECCSKPLAGWDGRKFDDEFTADGPEHMIRSGLLQPATTISDFESLRRILRKI